MTGVNLRLMVSYEINKDTLQTNAFTLNVDIFDTTLEKQLTFNHFEHETIHIKSNVLVTFFTITTK